MPQEKTATHQLILDFIRKHKLAVLSTVSSEGNPEAAAIGFGETDDLELIFHTSINFRKYANLQKSGKVAFVIGWDEAMTVQYEGTARELSVDDLEKCKEMYFEKNPAARKWTDKPDIRFFKVIPRWIRYTDLNTRPWTIHELAF